jgi:hypothetical protein
MPYRLSGLAVMGCLLVGWVGLSVAKPEWSLKSGDTMAVVGVTRGTDRLKGMTGKQLEDRRVGFGLSTLIAETLFDSGKFRLFEPHTMHERQLLADMVTTYWVESPPDYAEHDLYRVAQQLKLSLLAYGRIVHATARKRGVSFGPFSSHKQTLRVRVNVCLYDASQRTTLCREGQGKAAQTGTGVLYEYVGDRLDFARTAAGKATAEAVTLAVDELIEAIHFAP